TIVIEYGRGLTRTIHLNVDSHPADIEPSRAGHSIGRWEGDTLVVDTVGFLPGTLARQVVHSDQLHVVERFTLDPEKMELRREYVAEDPLYFASQYVGSDIVKPADAPFAVDPCKELTYINYAEGAEREAEWGEEPRRFPCGRAGGGAGRALRDGRLGDRRKYIHVGCDCAIHGAHAPQDAHITQRPPWRLRRRGLAALGASRTCRAGGIENSRLDGVPGRASIGDARVRAWTRRSRTIVITRSYVAAFRRVLHCGSTGHA